ncbi:MAG TPA: PPOX class F420-dependent oxidoreductase [Streptosporangiaceae bacterium]|jgi:pyridoxamine 5'-phosphate oxidase family protein
MIFTDSETSYLASQQLGRLATVQPDGTVQVNPVGFTHNQALGTIDISGYRMAASQKFRNVAARDRVAFVVDDIISREPWLVRCLEVRGTAEQVRPEAGAPAAGKDGALIRIRPRRVISLGLEEADRESPLPLLSARDVC